MHACTPPARTQRPTHAHTHTMAEDEHCDGCLELLNAAGVQLIRNEDPLAFIQFDEAVNPCPLSSEKLSRVNVEETFMLMATKLAEQHDELIALKCVLAQLQCKRKAGKRTRTPATPTHKHHKHSE